MRNVKLLPIFITLLFMLSACAGKEDVLPSPVPTSVSKQEETPKQEKKAKKTEKEQTLSVHEVGYVEDSTYHYLTVTQDKNMSVRANGNDPKALAALLEMRGTKSDKKESAVMHMRPSAIREAAQLVTFQTSMAQRYKELLLATEKHSAVMDTAFNFALCVLIRSKSARYKEVKTFRARRVYKHT